MLNCYVCIEEPVPGQVQAKNYGKAVVAEFTSMYFAVTSMGICVTEREMYTGLGK